MAPFNVLNEIFLFTCAGRNSRGIDDYWGDSYPINKYKGEHASFKT